MALSTFPPCPDSRNYNKWNIYTGCQKEDLQKGSNGEHKREEKGRRLKENMGTGDKRKTSKKEILHTEEIKRILHFFIECPLKCKNASMLIKFLFYINLKKFVILFSAVQL